ncbi:hypothetical protein [Agriterribacter sp.]|uniref:hypothetical protein n=1 Tax=Agriterribacter sp. TaxID=2821509 RepID=UPI002D09691F|nr:hypothetical protein [Agriterribacter sp.]HRO48210.1 hypothetical protein [Agriterribacter sp.]HRQ18729.1 hypothetical protein [Agriterribacter sp.]
MNKSLIGWFRIAVFNLMLVAFIGVLLRYKIAYALPVVHQKHLLHAHSHFAFTGWVTQILMALLVSRLYTGQQNPFKKYAPVLYANLIAAYGMLFTFPFQGYGTYSISFSTLSIFVAYAFTVMYWRDINRSEQKTPGDAWFKAALLFNVISSAGAFALAIMMATKTAHPDKYLAASYFFLHFQYNGWFFFACMGLLVHQIHAWGMRLSHHKTIFWLFTLSCIPAYFLSALWLPIPLWAYILVIVAVCFQLAGFTLLCRAVKERFRQLKPLIAPLAKWLTGLSGVALTIKLLLQTGSTIPALSKLAFGFRSIVIGYLHLVLLGVITLFILGYIVINRYMQINKTAVTGIIIFIAGIFFNELVLFIQGTGAISYTSVPYTNEMLLGAAVLLFAGLLILSISQRQGKVQE